MSLGLDIDPSGPESALVAGSINAAVTSSTDPLVTFVRGGVISGARRQGRALVDVPQLSLEPGRAVTIVGESGSGKSLLAHALMGSLPSSLQGHGLVSFGAERTPLQDASARRKLWGRRLALLPQEPVLALDPTMRVDQQVAEGHPGFLRGRRGRLAALEEAGNRLARLGLHGVQGAYPHILSGGMAQRVAFAAATIGGAEVLIADEPSKGLDTVARDALAQLLAHHVEQGGSLLTITHDLDLARALGGELLVMHKASVVEQGAARQVLAAPTHPWTRRLLNAEPSRWDPAWRNPTPETGAVTPLIETRGLSKAFGGHTLFSDLDVSISPGERLSLTGPSGCGKTTLGGIFLQLVEPDAGEVHHHADLAGGRLQKLYQDPTVAFPARVPIRTGLRDVVRRHRVGPERVAMLMDRLRLEHSLLDRRPGEVSGGELQRLAIIRAMLLEPRVIFADEPTSRLDLLTQQDTVDCLMGEVSEQDAALVLVTHDAGLAFAICDRNLSLQEAPSIASGRDAPARQGSR